MVAKQLIVAVEGTAAIGPFWQTIVSDYLDTIVRCFCGNESMGQNPSTPQVELSLVVFNAHGPYSACVVQRSGWTRDMNLLFHWLSVIPFVGGGFNDAAIAEGLAEALMMFSSSNGNQNQNMDAQRHCILVTASNPYPLPTPVYQPQPQPPCTEESKNIEIPTENLLSDAEALAKLFAQCDISLSVICPKKLPKLKAIYNAGNSNSRLADPPGDNNAKNPHFLVLISDNFMEARAALNRSGILNLKSNQNHVKMDATPAPISGPLLASVSSANGSVMTHQPISVAKIIPPVTVKLEPTTVPPASGPTFPLTSAVPRAASQSVSSLQTSSPLATSQDINENAQDMKPLVNNMTPSLRPAGGAAANVRILNDVAQACQALAGGTSIGLPSMGGTPILSNMISSGVTSSVPPAPTVISSSVTSIAGSLPMPATGQVAPNSASASFTSAVSTVTGNSSLSMSQPISNLQVSGSMGHTLPGMSQGNLPTTQMVQTGTGMNPNMTSGPGTSGMPSGNGTMMPTPGMSQPMQPIGMNGNSSVTNIAINQQTSSHSKYVKVWEGNLCGKRQGQPVFITRLEGYRKKSACETLAENWPPTMQIVGLSLTSEDNKQCVGKADFLVFRAMDQHGFLGQLLEKKLYAAIQLPSQKLLLSVSDKAYRLIGMLFPGDMVVFNPRAPNPRQQQQQQHLHLQQQQPLQQMQQQPLQQMQQQRPAHAVLQQQQLLMQPLQQQPQPMAQQQIPQLQQQQMAGMVVNQAYMRTAPVALTQGQVSSPNMPGVSFMS